VVVRYLYILRAVLGPDEADPELVVDTDAVLTFTVAPQGFQPVPRRDAQIL